MSGRKRPKSEVGDPVYSYSTPEEAIISLETAYTKQDMDAVLASIDFFEEAKLILAQAQYDYDLEDSVLVEETAKLLDQD